MELLAEVSPIALQVDLHPWSSETEGYQLRQMLTNVHLQKLGKEYIFFNTKDIVRDTFPMNYVEKYVSICNQVLGLRRAVVITVEEFFEAVAENIYLKSW